MNPTSPKTTPSPRNDDERSDLELDLDDAELTALGAHRGHAPEIVGFTTAQLRRDELAEGLGEGFVRSATSGEDDAEDVLDEVSIEELGGPFVESTDREEISYDEDPGEPEPRTPRVGTVSIAGRKV